MDEAEVQFNAVRLKLAEADAAKADLAASLKTAREQTHEATKAQQAAEAALSEARENLDERYSASSESAAALRAKEHRITQLQRQLTSQVGTCVQHALNDDLSEFRASSRMVLSMLPRCSPHIMNASCDHSKSSG